MPSSVALSSLSSFLVLSTSDWVGVLPSESINAFSAGIVCVRKVLNFVWVSFSFAPNATVVSPLAGGLGVGVAAGAGASVGAAIGVVDTDRVACHSNGLIL